MKAAIMPVAILIAIMLVLSGCIVEREDAAANGDAALQKAEYAQDARVSDLPGTANLSFSRSATSVITADAEPFRVPQFDFTNSTTPDGRLIVNYFYSAHCPACIALRPEIERLEADYPQVAWREFDISTQNGSWAYLQFANESGLNQSRRMVPQMLVNGTVITDRFNINMSLEGIIRAFSGSRPIASCGRMAS